MGERFVPLELLYNNTAVIFGIVYVYLPFMVLPLYATLDRLDRSLLEASLDLGASQVRTFFSIIVPMAKPGIVSGVILVFIPALGTFLISDLLGGTDSLLDRQRHRAAVQGRQSLALGRGDELRPALRHLRHSGASGVAHRAGGKPCSGVTRSGLWSTRGGSGSGSGSSPSSSFSMRPSSSSSSSASTTAGATSSGRASPRTTTSRRRRTRR